MWGEGGGASGTPPHPPMISDLPPPRAPDGSCVLTCSDDNVLRLFDLPAALCGPPRGPQPDLVRGGVLKGGVWGVPGGIRGSWGGVKGIWGW